MSHGPFVPNSFEIWPEFLTRYSSVSFWLTRQPDFYLKLKSLNKFERGSINPVNIGEIPLSGLGGSYYWQSTEGRVSSWQDGHPMTTTWVKKREPPFKDIWNCEKAESSSPLAIYKPHPEKILFLHMSKGADKLSKYIAGLGPMLLCYTDWKFSGPDWKISKDPQSKIKRLVFVSVSTWTHACESGAWTPKKHFLATRLI